MIYIKLTCQNTHFVRLGKPELVKETWMEKVRCVKIFCERACIKKNWSHDRSHLLPNWWTYCTGMSSLINTICFIIEGEQEQYFKYCMISNFEVTEIVTDDCSQGQVWRWGNRLQCAMWTGTILDTYCMHVLLVLILLNYTAKYIYMNESMSFVSMTNSTSNNTTTAINE